MDHDRVQQKGHTMPLKTMSSTEAKQQWGSVMNAASAPDDAVIVESHGKPKVAVISYDRFERLQELEEQAQRARALEQLCLVEERAGDRNSDLTDEQIDALADRFSREFAEDLVAEGKVTFEPESGA
ncbi:MAG: type II toxin-antitoxin system Phd/YefM family antitoxin [Chloroflexota bacterium]|nr:type II toxin-antitoxin system Phd/YefM family antitoxin [Chloroflexota bacterium]